MDSISSNYHKTPCIIVSWSDIDLLFFHNKANAKPRPSPKQCCPNQTIILHQTNPISKLWKTCYLFQNSVALRNCSWICNKLRQFKVQERDTNTNLGSYMKFLKWGHLISFKSSHIMVVLNFKLSCISEKEQVLSFLALNDSFSYNRPMHLLCALLQWKQQGKSSTKLKWRFKTSLHSTWKKCTVKKIEKDLSYPKW